MKQIYTTLLTLFFTASSFAGTIKAANNGDWEAKSTWNPKRLPADGDSIVIPEAIQVTVNDMNKLDDVRIAIYGTLVFEKGKLKLDEASRVIVQTTGKITGTGADEQISIDNVFKFKGNELLVVGYSYADATTGNIPNGFKQIAPITLPVIFQSFYAIRQSANIQLNWITSQEENNSHFEVERSTDGLNYKTIAVVLGALNSSLQNKYSLTDKNITDAVVYYRLRQVDMNGQAHYSAVRTVRNSQNASVTNIYASAKQTITIDFNSDVKNNVSVQVVNMNGQVVATREYKQVAYRVTLSVAAGAGIYAVRVGDAAGWSEVKKLAL